MIYFCKNCGVEESSQKLSVKCPECASFMVMYSSNKDREINKERKMQNIDEELRKLELKLKRR